MGSLDRLLPPTPAARRYMPVLPLVLVNGAEGIGTGWSTYIPNYNPRDIVANLRALLAGAPAAPMQPWYNGFRGTIQEVPSKTAGRSYAVHGTIAQVRATLCTVAPVKPSTVTAAVRRLAGISWSLGRVHGQSRAGCPAPTLCFGRRGCYVRLDALMRMTVVSWSAAMPCLQLGAMQRKQGA